MIQLGFASLGMMQRQLFLEIPSAPSALECSAHLGGAQPGEIKEPRVDCGTTLCCQETQGVAWHGMAAWLVADLGGGGVKLEKR